MPRSLIHCSICSKIHPNETSAIVCEESHVPVDKLKLIGVSHESGEVVPSKIIVNYGESPFQFAIYKLCQLGSKLIS